MVWKASHVPVQARNYLRVGMSRYYHAVRDDGRRCNRCNRRSQIFGNRDVASGWEGYCNVCNMQWYAWYLTSNVRLCNRGCRDRGLFQMLRSQASVEITTSFICRSPHEELMYSSLQHVYAIAQLTWLSCPLKWGYAGTKIQILKQSRKGLRDLYCELCEKYL